MSALENNMTSDDRNLALLAHLLGILTGFLGSLVIWLIHKDKPEKTFVNEQAKEALNFQITVFLAWIIAVASSFILIGFLLCPIIFIVNIVFCILAGVAASNGKNYRYPIALRLIK
ncbi:MAG: DUF4870 domain-containing protein [Burkholderiales bacterium]|jgi:uncharacterized Tic20 family protein|nr:DUF4870 domain-containing protein [Burkholderiales bacterium]